MRPVTGRARGERSRGGIRVAVAWFPAGEYERALAAWPELAEEWETVPHAEYCRRLEKDMRELTAHGLLIRGVAPLSIDGYVAWCTERGRDPAASGARAEYAADRERQGTTLPWPPAARAPCWCGSGAKYEECCARVGPAYPESPD